MCFYCDRNAYGNPKYWWWDNYVCWNCRVQNGILKNNTGKYNKHCGGRICYKCNQQMTNVGFKFKTPKKNDVKKWKELENTWAKQTKIINGNVVDVAPKGIHNPQTF